MRHMQFLGHRVLKVARVELMRRLQKMMLVVRSSMMNLNQYHGHDNHVECLYRVQKLPQLFQP